MKVSQPSPLNLREEALISQSLFLLTGKPTILAANVKDSDLAQTNDNKYVETVRAYGKEHHRCDTVVISAQIESELADLNEAEAKEFLEDLGVKESGVGQLIRAAYHLLGLHTYFTSAPRNARLDHTNWRYCSTSCRRHTHRF